MPRRRRSPSSRGRVRRTRAWAREGIIIADLGTAVTRTVLTADWEAERGVSLFEPGVVYGPLIGNFVLRVDATVPAGTTVTMGIGVFPATMDTDDLTPSVNVHLDWMWRWFTELGPSETVRLDGTSGERVSVRSRRRARNTQDRILLITEASIATGTIRLGGETSTLLTLP